jgi:hypothetical protein
MNYDLYPSQDLSLVIIALAQAAWSFRGSMLESVNIDKTAISELSETAWSFRIPVRWDALILQWRSAWRSAEEFIQREHNEVITKFRFL